MKFVALALGLAWSALLAPQSFAQNIDPASPYYGGLTLGLFATKDSSVTTASTLMSALGGSASVSQDTSGYLGRGFGGVHLDQTLSLELGYYQSAPATQKISGIASNNAAYTGTSNLSVSGWDYSVLIRPNRAFSHTGPFLRLGGHYLTVGGSVRLTAISTLASTTSFVGSGFLWGAGYDLRLSESFDIRIEYLGYKNIAGKDGATDNYCVAVVKHF